MVMPLTKGNPADDARIKDKLRSMPEEVEEDVRVVDGLVAGSPADLRSTRKGFRYAQRAIYGLPKHVRIRSLTGAEYLLIQKMPGTDDRPMWAIAMVDLHGNQALAQGCDINSDFDRWLDAALSELDELIEGWDAITLIELGTFIIGHCLKSTLQESIETAAKNSPAMS